MQSVFFFGIFGWDTLAFEEGAWKKWVQERTRERHARGETIYNHHHIYFSHHHHHHHISIVFPPPPPPPAHYYCFPRFLSLVFDKAFLNNGISYLILLRAIISRVFQLILVKLLIVFYNNMSTCSLGVFPVVLICILPDLRRVKLCKTLTVFHFLELERRKRFCNS